jgi:CRP-like cAMP-binding protein
MNQIIYKEGQVPDGIYLIESGEFEMTKTIVENKVTSHFRVSRLGQNQMFGLQECINRTKRVTD